MFQYTEHPIPADQGILVHSCFVRDGVGNEFNLLDDRGQVIPIF